MDNSKQIIYILGTKINDLSIDQVINKIESFLLTNKKGYVVTPNPEICLKAYQDKKLRRILKDSVLSIPDGFGLKIGALFFGTHLKNTTTGIDLCWELFKLSEQKKYSILLLGGEQKNGEQAINKIQQKHPKLVINYLNGGDFNTKGNHNNQNLIQNINKFDSDLILVNLGAPKQEYFMSNNYKNINAKLLFGVGGSIDFISGFRQRAPKAWRNWGFEWLWRLIQEPSRFPRIFNAVIKFPLTCLFFRIKSKLYYRKNVAGFIINNNKQILIAKHAAHNYWQIPQGGAKNAKTKTDFEQAILREMQQELGTNKFSILKMVKNCYKYKWPSTDTLFDHYKGQKQTLFLLKFYGSDSDIKLDLNEHSQWRWVNKENILNIMPDIKKPLITIALNNFKEYL